MKRRDFVAAGLAGLGAVGLSSSSKASPRPSDTLPVAGTAGSDVDVWRSSAPTGEAWDGRVRAERGEAGRVEASTPSVDASAPQLSDAEIARLELASELTELVSPLRGGSDLAGSTLREVYVDEWGSGVAIVEDARGRIARLDICRRQGDPGVEPLAQTTGYEVYVRNGANGQRSTERDTILAARSLADVIRTNEGGAQLALVSKQEYWRSEHWS